jgi:hypothetical protein
MKSVAATKTIIARAVELSLSTGKKVSISLKPNPRYKKDKTVSKFIASFIIHKEPHKFKIIPQASSTQEHSLG